MGWDNVSVVLCLTGLQFQGTFELSLTVFTYWYIWLVVGIETEVTLPSHRGFYIVSSTPYCTLLKMGRYYNTTTCHYWDMSVK